MLVVHFGGSGIRCYDWFILLVQQSNLFHYIISDRVISRIGTWLGKTKKVTITKVVTVNEAFQGVTATSDTTLKTSDTELSNQ